MKSQTQIYSRYFTYIKPFTRIPIIKTYGSTIFSLSVIIVFIIFAIKPTVETILVLQKEVENFTQVLEKVSEKANNLSLGKQNYEKLDPTIKSRIEAGIPDGVQVKTVIQNLETLAKNHEASISALQFQPVGLEVKAQNQPGFLAEISFTFNVEGKYQDLLLLLEDLKRSSRLISIENLSLSRLTENTGLIMSITGKAYYLK